MTDSAVISRCGRYRYFLRRDPTWPVRQEQPAVFVLHNPSTADATINDPTVRRGLGFAASWGANGLIFANVYAGRATDPRDLFKMDDPVGPKNDAWLAYLAQEHQQLVCAWGANAKPERVGFVVQLLLTAGAKLYCLGTTKAGHPKHPLYIRADQPLVRWG